MQSAGGQQASEPSQKSAKMLAFYYGCEPPPLSRACNFNAFFKVETVGSEGQCGYRLSGSPIQGTASV